MRWLRVVRIGERRAESARWNGAKHMYHLAWVMMLGATFLAPNSSSAAGAQNQKKEKKQPESVDIISPVPMPDSQAIDLDVSQMLGAWQVGDTAAMQKYYADDVVVVSGMWEQPVIGWNNYALAYEAQHARTKLARLERTNTYTKVFGDAAWVTYQWSFTGEVDGAPMSALGHTTLVMQKRDGKWVIVLNHTSTAPAPERSDASQSGIPKS